MMTKEKGMGRKKREEGRDAKKVIGKRERTSNPSLFPRMQSS